MAAADATSVPAKAALVKIGFNVVTSLLVGPPVFNEQQVRLVSYALALPPQSGKPIRSGIDKPTEPSASTRSRC
jgi:hypothetical protein